MQVLALTTDMQLDVFDTNSSMISRSLTMSHAIVYCCWLTADTMAIVTTFGVYHWCCEGGGHTHAQALPTHPRRYSGQ